MKSNYLSFAMSLMTCLASLFVQAQTWTGGGANWNDPASWSSNPVLPANGSTITIDGSFAMMDVASSFNPGQINITNGGDLFITNTLSMDTDGLVTIDGFASRISMSTGGLFNAEFIDVTNGGEIGIADGELEVDDQLTMTDGTLTMFGGLLDYNGGVGEELLFNNTTINMNAGTIEFDRTISITGGATSLSPGATITATGTMQDIEFHDVFFASLEGNINNSDGDLSLFGTSNIDLRSSSLVFDDLILNDDGSSSNLNVINNASVSFDELIFDTSQPDDAFGDSDRIYVDIGSSLTINTFVDANQIDPTNNVHAAGNGTDAGGTITFGNLEGYSDDGEQAYNMGTLSSDYGAQITVGGGIPLPVELISFEGYDQKDRIVLKWSTAVEINNECFYVLKSLDGNNFKQIGKINGVGNSNSITEYSFTDYPEQSGIYFFQLKQLDFNGDSEYHHVISVPYNAINDRKLTVFPNPAATDKVSISSSMNITAPTLSMYSLTGQLVYQKKLSTGSKWTLSVSEMNISRGEYILKMYDTISGQSLDPVKITIID